MERKCKVCNVQVCMKRVNVKDVLIRLCGIFLSYAQVLVWGGERLLGDRPTFRQM